MRTQEELIFGELPDRLPQPDRTEQRLNQLFLFFLTLVAAIYLGTAGVPRLFDQIDGQYAGAAREMLARGDWLVPTQDGIPRLQKPPLVYWCEMISLSLFGTNEFAARFPVILATVAWFFVTAALVERLSGRWLHGLCAALILATFVGSYIFTHLVMPEPFSAFFLIGTLYALTRALQSDTDQIRNRWLLLAWFCIGLGTLTKGLHALLIPLVIAGVSWFFKKESRNAWRYFLFRPHGWILFFLMVTPWYAAIEMRYPGFLADQLGNEQIGNIVNRRWPIDSDRVPFFQFLVEHVGLLFPWSFFLPGAAIALWRSRKNWLQGEWHLLLFLLLINLGGILFAKIQDYYLLISWPAVAAGSASLFVADRKVSRLFFSVPGWCFVLTGLAGLTAALWAVGHPGKASELADTFVHERTIWEGIGGISSGQLSHLTPLILIVSLATTLGGATVIYFARKGRALEIAGSCAIFMFIVFATSNWGLFSVEDKFSSARIASSIEKLGGEQYQVVCEFETNDLTSLFFYLPHSIQWLHANPEMEFATRKLGIGRELYLDQDRFLTLWRGAERVFLVTDQGRLDYWRRTLQLDEQHASPLAVVGTKMILVNRAPAASANSQ